MDAKKTNMIYRYLGNSGLKVSALSWGNWINTKGDDMTYETLKVAVEGGVNFFDTAEIYGMGQGESTLGEAIKKLNTRREDLVISTKIFRCGNGVNDGFLSRKHIVEGLNNSLKRLQLSYVDVVFCHRYDRDTPLEETVRAMHHVIDKGLAFYWGTSEWEASQIMEAHKICEQYGLIKPIVEQPQYNMFVRDKLENQYTHLFQRTKLGTTVWSPLMSGVLTGKYIDEVPKDSRFDSFAESARMHYADYNKNKESYDKKLKALKQVAEKLNTTLPKLALAWVIKNPDVSTCIVGSSKVEQFKENLDAVNVVALLTNEVELEIEKILDNAPLGEMNWRDFTRLGNRRHQNLNLTLPTL